MCNRVKKIEERKSVQRYARVEINVKNCNENISIN